MWIAVYGNTMVSSQEVQKQRVECLGAGIVFVMCDPSKQKARHSVSNGIGSIEVRNAREILLKGDGRPLIGC
jgi:chorismate-pyruvate lyase